MTTEADDPSAWILRLRAIATADGVAAHQRCGRPAPAPQPSRREFLTPLAPVMDRLRGFLLDDSE